MAQTLDHPSMDTDIDVDSLFDEIVKNEEQFDDGDTGDHERMSHYVTKEDIVRSSMTGAPVYALCGKKWTPRRNPENFPVCPECKTKYEELAED